MKKGILLTVAGLSMMAASSALNAMQSDSQHQNPFLRPYTTQFAIPPFEQIVYADYIPAIEAGIDEQRKQVEAIIKNPEAPTFENTILALEQSGETLRRAVAVFAMLDEADSTPEMSEIAAKVYPMVTAWDDELSMNEGVFKRVKHLYDNLDKLNLPTPERRAVEESYRNFVRGGALLNPAQKKELSAINAKLADLFLQFNKNLLNATNEFAYIVSDRAELSGLPSEVVAVAAEEAKTRGKAGSWAFTLHAPCRLPVLQFANSRALRKAIYDGYTTLASNGKYNNYPVIQQIVKLRSEKAHLLGYKDFASYMTANVMAKNPENAENLLMQIWRPAVKKVAEEVADMQAIADKEGKGIKLEPHDYYYYAEKVRRQRYDLDEDQVKGYFAADSVRKGVFKMAEMLYGVTFTELPDAPKYHPDVNVYEVKDLKGNHVAVFMTDFFTRATKRQGAWMDCIQPAFTDPDGTSARPIVYNVANFAKPSAEAPSLLSIDDVQTAFHEFGHALQGMLTTAKLRSQSGTGVDRDAVEVSSQMHEHFAFQPELLRQYARHYKTGEVIPDSLVAKINAAATHNQGFMTTELVGAALLDLNYGRLNPAKAEDVDVAAFENQVSKKLGRPALVQYRYRSPYFKHIFGSDGYASGYYTYLWAETLERDAFDLFEQNGVFDPATAKSFKENILEPGGSEDPMVLYVRFRGHEPSVQPLLRGRGLE